MDSISLPFRFVAGAALAGSLLVAGCANEAGSQITPASFGNATMNNHLVQTCQAGPGTEAAKYVSKIGGCTPRSLDGKYAQATYQTYIGDAQREPQIINFAGGTN